MAQAAGVSPSQSTTQDAPPRTKGSVMATTLVGAHAFEHLYAHSIPIIILAIITEFELGALSVGAVVAIRSIFGGITSTAGGFLVDLFHHRVAWVLAISTLMIGTGYLLMSIAPSYALILCALALGSMGSALWHPPALGLLARRFPERRGLFISMHRSTGSVGDVIGPLAAGALIAGALTWSGGVGDAEVAVSWPLPWGTVDWRYILGFSTPVMFIATVVIFILLRNAGSERPVNVDIGARVRTNWAGMKDAFRGTGMWSIFTVSAVRGMADRSLVFLVPLYLIHLGVGEFQAAVHVMLMVLPGILFGPIIGSLSDRIGRRPLIIFIMGVTTMLTIAIIMVSGEGYSPWITVFVAIYGMMNFSVNNLTQAAAADIAAGRRLESSFLGLMWGNNTLFGAIAAFMIFGPVEWFDWQYGFFIAAAIYFAGFLVSLLIPGKPREPEAVPSPA
ncbi:MAG: MFS transporter [Chloroflexi bacterium]|nr:MFS transporter [Chloroflexota bacterium]